MLSLMVIFYCLWEKLIEVVWYKVLWVMNIVFGILFVIVFFYVVLFMLVMGYDEVVKVYEQNIFVLVIVVQFISGDGVVWVKVVSVIFNIFVVMIVFFGVYLGFCEVM